MRLANLITAKEANALRECARANYIGHLELYLPSQYRIGLGLMDDTPFRLIVKIGTDPRSDWTKLQRRTLGLWEQHYFKVGPHCRLCGQRIKDGERTLAFAFNLAGDTDRWRDRWMKSFIHAEECQ